MVKKEKLEIVESDVLESLEANGIPVMTAVFHKPVQSYGSNGIVGEPETAFYAAISKAKPSRTAEMFYSPSGLLCKQKYGTLIIPLTNVAFARVK